MANRRRLPRCTICNHPQAARLAWLCATGNSIAAVARQFEVSQDALERHYKNHVTDGFKSAARVGPLGDEDSLRSLIAKTGTSVLENLRAAQAGIISRWLRAMEAGDDHQFVGLTKVLHENLRMQAQLTRELMPNGPSVQINNTLISGDWLTDFGRDLMELGRAHPEVRPALVALLRRRIGAEAEPALRNVTPELADAR